MPLVLPPEVVVGDPESPETDLEATPVVRMTDGSAGGSVSAGAVADTDAAIIGRTIRLSLE